MDWAALKSNECPACGSYLEHPDEFEMIYCTQESGPCDFKIRSKRYNELVDDMEDKDDYKMYSM